MIERKASFEEDALDFNFWPSFSDLMLSLVLILVLVFFLLLSVMAAETVNLSHIKQSQMALIQNLTAAYGVTPNEISPGYFDIPLAGIMIKNEPTLQRITFTDRILFPPDKHELSEAGKTTLSTVGDLIKKQLSFIREIQIQGHADTDKSSLFSSNLELAANRAMEVYKYLQNEVCIDPIEHLMSATSFGEFKPVNRLDADLTYDQSRLAMDNSTKNLKDKNRRIELLLFYSVEVKE